MTETTIHAQIQTLLQSLSDFDDADVSLRDYRILDANASPPYAVIVPGPFETVTGAISFGEKTPIFWRVLIDLFVLPKQDNAEWADMLTLTWNVVYKLFQYFTLNALSGIINVTVEGDEPDYIKTIGETKLLARTLRLTVTEKVDVAGGEYPS